MPKFCNSCGASVIDSARFCNKCGTRLVPTQPANVQPAEATPPSNEPSPKYEPPSQYPQPPPQPVQQPMQSYAASPSTSSGLQTNVAGLLCYILGLVTGIVFLVLDPYNKNKFIRFHAFQSIFFHVAIIGLWIVLSIFDAILPWGLSFIISLGRVVVWLGGLALWIYLMVKAYNNEKYKLPIIGDLAEQQAG